MSRVSIYDLRRAADWLRAYEGSDTEGDTTDDMFRVADWLDAEADERELKQLARAVRKEIPCADPTWVREIARGIIAKREAPQGVVAKRGV